MATIPPSTVTAEHLRRLFRVPHWGWFLPATVVLVVGILNLWDFQPNHRERQIVEKIDESGEIALPAETKLAIECDIFNLSNIPTSLAFSPDGRTLFIGTGCWNAMVRSWDVATGKLLHEVEVEERVKYLRIDNGSFVLSIAPDINNSTIAIGGRFPKRTNFVTWDGESGVVGEVAGMTVPVTVAPGLVPSEYFCGAPDGEVKRSGYKAVTRDMIRHRPRLAYHSSPRGPSPCVC